MSRLQLFRVNERPALVWLGDEAGVTITGLRHSVHGLTVDGGSAGRRLAIQPGSTRAESATSSAPGRSPLARAPPNCGGVRDTAAHELSVKRYERPHCAQRSHNGRPIVAGRWLKTLRPPRPQAPVPVSDVDGSARGDRLVLVASNYGKQRNPAWYYNLRANPRCSTVFRRQRLWELDVSVYQPRNHYAQRAGNRRILVIVLQPAPIPTG